MLNVPMLAHHTYKCRGRPDETGNVDAIVTRAGGITVGHPHGFDDNHGVEVRPFGAFRARWEVGEGPNSSAYRATVRVIKGIKAMLGRAPRSLVFNVRMNVPLNHSGGL